MMAKPFLRLNHVTFEYKTSTKPIFKDISFHISKGWTGVVGPNGAGKTTILLLAVGLLFPDSGRVKGPGSVFYCPQRIDNPPYGLDKLLIVEDKHAFRIRWMLGLQDDWLDRWDTLSHGERKRCQIGVALQQEPTLLAIDEPTNHLDRKSRQYLLDALQTCKGVGLIVSHDRELLDTLCKQCLFLEPPEVILRHGGVTQGMAVAETEKKAAKRQFQIKKQALKKLDREASRRQSLAEISKKKTSKRGLSKKDHDAKAKIDLGRLTGKDAVGGRLLNQMKGRVQRARREMSNLSIKKDYNLGIWMDSVVSHRKNLLQIKKGILTMGPKKLHHPDLVIGNRDRIALTGPNGAGKTTLIKRIIKDLSVPFEQLTYIPQEIDTLKSQNLLKEALRLPGAKLGFLMAIIRRLGSNPEGLLESDAPSPGEGRKLMLAMGMTRLPQMIIMDEPTNHMDLPSVTCLEEALADCPCALILVSHDEQFLKSLTDIRWHIESGSSKEQNDLKIGTMNKG